MDLEDDDPLTLPKWPFYVGDGFLVGSAIAIAGLSGWNLSNWQVASCVIAVALGAALFVLPFIVEYQLRLKNRSDTFTYGQAVLSRRMELLETRIDELAAAFSALPGQVDATSQVVDGLRDLAAGKLVALEGELGRIRKELAAAKAAGGEPSGLKALQEALAGLRGDLQSLERKTEKNLESLKAEIPEDGGVQAAVFAALSDKVKALDSRLRTVGNEAEATGPKAVPEKKTREKRSLKPNLLHRAMREKDESGTPAVKRIISAGPKGDADEAELPEGPPAAEAEAAGGALEPEDPAPPPAGPVPQVRQAKAVAAPEPPQSPRQPQEPEAPVAMDFLADLPQDGVKRRHRPKEGESGVLANVFIGIGNKPFIRGSGGGLSWDKGVPMDFEEIGKWRWTAPSGCGEIEVQLFRNDEDPDRRGRQLLKAGATLELKPEFD